jgi:hypothetical protein
VGLASLDAGFGSVIGINPISHAAKSPAAAPGIAVEGRRQVEIRPLSGIQTNASTRRDTAHEFDKKRFSGSMAGMDMATAPFRTAQRRAESMFVEIGGLPTA